MSARCGVLKKGLTQADIVRDRDVTSITLDMVGFCPSMSAIASFIRVPKSSLQGLRKAIASGTDYDYLRANGQQVAEYGWSGYVLATLLPYLQEKHQIDLMKAEYDDIAGLLTDATGATHFIFTPSQKAAFLNRLDTAQYSEEELRDYFNAFNETNEQEIGRAMLDGIGAFRETLRQLDEGSVIVFGIL